MTFEWKQREIKVKFYDKRTGKLAWPNDVLPHILSLGVDSPVWQVCASEYHMVQYTGLKDKNGKEIYEGDIIALNHRSGASGVVVFRTTAFGIKGKGIDPAHVLFDWLGRLEVIGNVFENPELLEEVK